MRKPGQWGIMSLAVLFALGFCSLAMAQRGGRGGQPGGGGFGGGPPGGGFGGGGTLGVLQDENVRKEVGILPEQYEKIQAIGEKMRSSMGDLFTGMRDLSPEERTAKFAEIRETMTARTAEIQKEINDVLLPDQVARLEQVAVQSQLRRSGTADALTSGVVAEKLGLSPDDIERIRKVAEEADNELRAKTEQLREEAKQKIIAAMTPAQQAKFKQLVGNPVEFSQNRGGFGGGGPGGGGPGGRGGPGGGGGRTTLQRPADGD